MLVLFDQGTPVPSASFSQQLTRFGRLRNSSGRPWGNGQLLDAAEAAGFEVLLTTDKKIRYQQNLAGRRIAIVVLGQARWPLVRLHAARVVAAVDAATPGSYAEVEIPEST